MLRRGISNLRVQDPIVVLGVAVALIYRLAFLIGTNRVWEDSLITIAHARNAVNGLGLTHHPGEGLIHGFTSAISVLVPLVGEAAAAGSGLFVLRLVSLAAAVATVVFADRLGRLLGLSSAARSLVVLFLAVDQLHVFYGMAGMETQIAVAILLASAVAVLSGWTVRAGVLLGLCLLARPDFLLWVVPALAWMMVPSPRRAGLAAVATAATIAPWIAFTIIAYGSPIPQTIIAKSAIYTGFPTSFDRATIGTWFVSQVDTHLGTLWRMFVPFFENTLVVSAPLPEVLGLVGGVMWLLLVFGLTRRAAARVWQPLAAFVALAIVYRTFALPTSYFDWYVPPFTAIAMFFVAAGIEDAGRLLARFRPTFDRAFVDAAAAGLVLAFGMHLPATIQLERAAQGVEDSVRVPVGLFLKEEMKPGQAFLAEAAGYFEFYAGTDMWDFPGLTSARGLEATRSLPAQHRQIVDVVNVLRPDWLVLRPFELATLQQRFPETAAEYMPIKTFGRQLTSNDAYGVILQSIDDQFIVLSRTP